MKNVLAIMMMAFALVVVGSLDNQAEAYEVYVGTYSDGTAVYLLTESIDKKSRNTSYETTCTLRAGNVYLDYGFERMDGRIGYRNSEGYHGYIDDGSSPIAYKIYYMCKQYR